MALADRLVKTEPKSKFESWLDSLNDNNLRVVLGWLSDASISNTRISEMIRDDDPEDDFRGYRATKDTISAWRRANVAR